LISTNPKSSTRVAGGNLAVALVCALTMPIMPMLALGPNLPQLFEHFAAVPHVNFLVPLLVTMPSVCIALLSPMAGAIADRFGRRRILLVACAVFALFGTLPFWLESLPSLLASMFVVGAAEAMILPCGNALMGDYFPPESRKRWLGLQGICGPILVTLVMLAGGALGSLSWHAPFLVNILGAVIFVWLLLSSWEPEAVIADNAPTNGAPTGFPWAIMLPVFAISMLVGLYYFFQIGLGLFFSRLGLHTPLSIGVVTTVSSVGVIAGGWYFRQQRPRPVAFNLMLMFLAFGIGYLGIGLSSNYLVALPFAIIVQFGNGLFIPTLVGWALSKLEPTYRGRGMGLWTTCVFTAQFLSPPILAVIAQSYGGNHLAAAIFAGLVSLVPATIAAFKLRGAQPLAAAMH
jgi:MFS family permease